MVLSNTIQIYVFYATTKPFTVFFLPERVELYEFILAAGTRHDYDLNPGSFNLESRAFTN